MTLEERFAELAEQFAGAPGVTGPGDDSTVARRGFGANALKINGSIFAMLTRGQLVVKLPASRVRELISAGAGDPFDAGKGRPMREWVALRADDSASWQKLATEAAAFVGR